MIGIYKITNPKDKVYIGQSSNIENRFYSYSNLKCKGQKKLFNSFNKYGFENHEFEVLEIIEDKSNLDYKENYYFNYYKSLGHEMLNCIVPSGLTNSYCSEDTRNLISRVKSRPVLQYTKSGEKLKEWNSIKEIVRELDVLYQSINKCCIGKQKTCAGYIWRYNNSENLIIPDFNRKVTNRKKRNIRIKRPIFQYSKEGVLIKEWFNAKIASEELNINQNAINECANGNTRTSGGFVWKRKKDLVD